MAETASKPMDRRRKAPAWAHEELDAWAAGARTGDLHYEFLDGQAKKARRGEVIDPPRGPVAREETQCPQCGGPTTESDYMVKRTCQRCERTWTIYEIRRLLNPPSGSARKS